MSMPLLGQFDPEFTRYMNEVMVLLRQLFQTHNHWALLVDGTARAGIEAILVSLLEPGERVLVPVFGRFGHLLGEIAGRCGAEVRCIDTAWGSVFPPEQIEAALRQHRPRLVAVVHGDTSTTMAQPLADLGAMWFAVGPVRCSARLTTRALRLFRKASISRPDPEFGCLSVLLPHFDTSADRGL
jgi:(S)-ureidoglycine-glyoxylate aminotransferase